MDFRILGPPELSGSEPQDVRLSPQLWGVLASLLMAEGKPVPVDSLVDHLWDWNPPPMATATIRTYVSRINTLLEHYGIRIGRRARGYELLVDPQAVDLHRFRSLRRQAESVARSGDLGHAAALLRQADELWRGPALMGLSGEWISARRRALDEERHEAVKLRIGIELDLGQQASVLGELRELSERHPFDEEIARDLMISLYRLGRTKDAIHVGRDVSERFVEAGMEPGPQLRDVHTRILRGDSGLGVTPAYRSSGQAGQPNTLPFEASDFVGRADEAGLLTAECHGNVPLLKVIEGMGGVGKTALAVHVAHRMTARYPDAQLFVQFPAGGPGDGAADALHQLLRMLGVPAARIPAEAGERVTLWRAEMAHRRAVIVVDDAPGPDQVAPIALAAGDSLTIVTSRQHANWPGQRVLRLEPLGAGDSVDLLRRSASSAAERDADKMAMVASLCGGLPLAIRVAAGRLREGYLADLDSLIDELADVHAGRADGTEAGRRIFSAFECSYRQLTTECKRMFRILGASPCADFSLDAAAALADGAAGSAADRLMELSERYLLERTPTGRFQFHGLIRSYAAECCAKEEPESERRRATGRLIQYYSDALRAATAANREFSRQDSTDHAGTEQGRYLAKFPDADIAHAWLEEEWRNILLTARHAATHEQHRQCADLTHFLDAFLHTGGYWSDAVPAHELALQACRLLGDRARISRAALDLSTACRRIGDYDKARRHADEALTAYTSLGDRRGQAGALVQLGIIHWGSGSARDGLAYQQEAADLYHDAGDQSGTATALMNAATAFGSLGRYAEEARNLGRALRLFEEAGDRRGEAMCLNNLGAAVDDRGLHRDAVAYYEKSIDIFREIGGRQNLALLEHNLGRVQQYKGNYEEAIAVYRKALATYYDIGDLQHQATALSDIGAAFVSKECYSEALVHHRKSAELAEAIGDRSQFALALCGLADAYRGSGSHGIAAENYSRAHRLAAEIEAPYLSGKALYGMAETLLITQGLAAAKIYWRQAHDIFSQLGLPDAAIIELRLHGLGATAS
jgi:DNA-binding SARP family transcriptional activator/tetratricopeptide (TPR) repeat protein